MKVSGIKVRLLTSPSPLDIAGGKEVLRLEKCITEWPFNLTIVEADPFLFAHNGRIYLFYEHVIWSKKGEIKMISSADLVNWTDPVTVLKETCHISYPYVFEHEGEIYMIPETCAFKEIRIYKADNSQLTHFSYHTTILKEDESDTSEISFSDSSIYKIDDIYYLHTCRQKDGVNNLELYISRSLFGSYVKHPASPMVVNQKFGRNAGSLFSYNGKLYRPAMNCENGYGDGVGLFEVDRMTPTEYSEHIVNDNLLQSSGNEFYRFNGHHFNTAVFNGQYIISTDSNEDRYYFVRRVIDKIKGLLK